MQTRRAGKEITGISHEVIQPAQNDSNVSGPSLGVYADVWEECQKSSH